MVCLALSHNRRNCSFPSWRSQRPWRVHGEKALLVFLFLFSFSLFPPQVSDLLSTGCFSTPVQVTGLLASWFLNQIFMPRQFLTLRWIPHKMCLNFFPYRSWGTSRIIWILDWRSFIRFKLGPQPLLPLLSRKERSEWEIPICTMIVPSPVSSAPFFSSCGCFPGWLEIISAFPQMEQWCALLWN